MPVVNTAMGMAALGGEILLTAAIVGLLTPLAEEITKLFMKRTA
jgi:hypothetical protein